MKVIFSERALDEYMAWQSGDKKTLKRINALLKDIQRNGHTGIGKPEPLRRFDGYWSRRIDDVHRIVYRLTDAGIEVLQCRGHYQ